MVNILQVTQGLGLFIGIVVGSLVIFLSWLFFRMKIMGKSLLPQEGPPGEFAWTTLGLCLWYFSGLVLDGWAHTHGEVDASFFTPWHALFYSGFIAYSGFIIWTLWRISTEPFSFSKNWFISFFSGMPKGYGPAVVGMILFGIAGVGDMIWHILFGLEGGLDILLSPTHLMLAAGMAIGVMAPFWVSWHHSHDKEHLFKNQLSGVVSLGICMSVLTFFTRFAHLQNLNLKEICRGHGSAIIAQADNCTTSLRFSQNLPTTAVFSDDGFQLGIISMQLQAVIMMGIILLYLKRWNPARGTLLTLFAVNGLAVSFLAPGPLEDIPGKLLLTIVIGIIAEFLYHFVQPKSNRIRWFSFGFLLPLLANLAWWVFMIINHGFSFEIENSEIILGPLGWSIHGTFGTFVAAGFTGAFIALISDSPELPNHSMVSD